MKKVFFSFLFIIVAVVLVPIVHGDTIVANISPTLLPGQSTSTQPGYFINNFYQFALVVGGVLAFGVVVYGGIRYITSAGNPSGQSDAKEWIWGALLGLLLLVGAYFLLKVINPDLTSLNLPALNQVQLQSGGSGNNNGGGFNGFGGGGSGGGGAGGNY